MVNLTFLKGEGGVNMCFKFKQNRTMNEEFDFFERRGGVLNLVVIGQFSHKYCFFMKI